jgi:hypothetical protein
MESICDCPVEHIIKGDSVLGTEARFYTAEGSGVCTPEIYNAVGYEIEQDGKTFNMVVFTDITELKTLEKRIRDEETIIAFAIIDNLEELLQYIQEGYGDASEMVEKILKKYFQDVGGFVREYGNNRFMCVFDAKRLEALEADRFSLLDEIREIRLGESTLSVTISMGIAKTGGTLYERERATQAALDMALQRGGEQLRIVGADQIVLGGQEDGGGRESLDVIGDFIIRFQRFFDGAAVEAAALGGIGRDVAYVPAQAGDGVDGEHGLRLRQAEADIAPSRIPQADQVSAC